MTRPRLLALRALGMGDLLTGVPVLRALAAAFPDHHRILAAPGWLGPLVELVDAVDQHLPVGELQPLPADLAGVDVAVNLHGSGPESHRLLTALGPRRLIAFRHPAVGETDDAPAWSDDEHEIDRWCRLLDANGIPADASELRLAPPVRLEAAVASMVAGVAGATVVHPGAKSGARRWPVENHAAVARAEVDAGRPVVVTGSADEQPLAEKVAELAGLPDAAVLAGRLDLRGLAAVVAAAGRLVAGDTGVGHLATALATPSVLLFGPTPPALWGPPPELRDRHRVIWHGRTGDPLADVPFPGLTGITVAEVLAKLEQLGRVAPLRTSGTAYAGK